VLKADPLAAAFDPSFIVPFAGAREAGLEQVVAGDGREAIRQLALGADALGDGARKVVIVLCPSPLCGAESQSFRRTAIGA